jgi:molybdopterin/thiamine biosynthesis adenylyltransferase
MKSNKKQQENMDYDIIEYSNINDDKFDRQKRIQGWDQEKISSATVMIIGAGATGNEVVKNLVLAGIGKILLIDYDIIEKSNLNRCILFNFQSKKETAYKVDVVKHTCNALNPETKIVPIKKDLNDIDKSLYKKADIVCSCLDNVEARIQANNYAYYNGKPFIDSGIEEFFGSVQSIFSGVKKAPCLQCGITETDLDIMWQKFSCTGEEIETQNGETIGKIATVITTTSIIGGIQAQEVIKFILGLETFYENEKWPENVGMPLIGKQLNYNGIKNDFTIIKKVKNPNCWICSHVS